MRLSKLKACVAFTISCFIAGCSNVKAPNEANFTKSMQDFLDTKYDNCYYKATFPDYNTHLNAFGEDMNLQLEALAKIGFLDKKQLSDEEAKQKNPFHDPKKPIIAYTINDLGKKYSKENEKKQKAFCFGKAHIEKITNFTEPADRFGYKVVDVNYTYKISDIPDIIAKSDLPKNFEKLNKAIQSSTKPIEDKHTLVLTEKGWVSYKIMGI
jgi:hypothetical protein